MLTGCGSDNDNGNDANNNQNTGGNNQNSGSLTETQKQKILDVVEETSEISLKESLLSGVVDTLVYGTDEADADEECASGSYTKNADVITFNNCNGLFKAATGLSQYQNLTANGQITIKDGMYQYQNLVLLNPDTGESKTVTGTLKLSGNDLSSVISTDSLTVKATEKNGSTFSDVNYTLQNYTLNYDKKSATELALATSGTLTASNSSVGDYKVKFETTSPLLIQLDSEEEIISYPYAGELKVTNTGYGSITTLTANTDKKTVRYVVNVAEKELASGTKNWSEALGYN